MKLLGYFLILENPTKTKYFKNNMNTPFMIMKSLEHFLISEYRAEVKDFEYMIFFNLDEIFPIQFK